MAVKFKTLKIQEPSYNALIQAIDALERLTGKRPTISEAHRIFAEWAKDEAQGRREALEFGREAGFHHGWAYGLAVLAHSIGELLREAGVFHGAAVAFYFSPKADQVSPGLQVPDLRWQGARRQVRDRREGHLERSQRLANEGRSPDRNPQALRRALAASTRVPF